MTSTSVRMNGIFSNDLHEKAACRCFFSKPLALDLLHGISSHQARWIFVVVSILSLKGTESMNILER